MCHSNNHGTGCFDGAAAGYDRGGRPAYSDRSTAAGVLLSATSSVHPGCTPACSRPAAEPAPRRGAQPRAHAAPCARPVLRRPDVRRGGARRRPRRQQRAARARARAPVQGRGAPGCGLGRAGRRARRRGRPLPWPWARWPRRRPGRRLVRGRAGAGGGRGRSGLGAARCCQRGREEEARPGALHKGGGGQPCAPVYIDSTPWAPRGAKEWRCQCGGREACAQTAALRGRVTV